MLVLVISLRPLVLSETHPSGIDRVIAQPKFINGFQDMSFFNNLLRPAIQGEPLLPRWQLVPGKNLVNVGTPSSNMESAATAKFYHPLQGYIFLFQSRIKL